ncbi:peptidase M23 [Alteromonadaceae bacterium M269]|nr:peptidase M23 [Alteromonadaceae bacterium M269]
MSSRLILKQLLSIALFWALLVLVSNTLWAQQTEQDLENIQQQIKKTQQQINEQLSIANELEEQLKQAEIKIAESVKALNQTQNRIKENTQQQATLKRQKQELEQKKAVQQDVLEKQIRSAFMTGNYDYAKMLLVQDNASKIERTLTYYQYLNKARQEQIDELQVVVQDLDATNQEIAQKVSELEDIKATQQTQKSKLDQQQQRRQTTLAKLRTSISSDAAKVEQLQLSERNLLQIIAQAQQKPETTTVTLTGLQREKGQLLKPTRGRMRSLFGKRRQGQLRWKGVVFNGIEGSPVKAIYNGKVLYADWLKGFGLVTVVDHGEGFMSLYGHNQALLKQAGDIVTTGENIALVGQSGGQPEPGLYFEIRHKGQAINPNQWLKR